MLTLIEAAMNAALHRSSVHVCMPPSMPAACAVAIWVSVCLRGT